jgi:hypothetical protein
MARTRTRYAARRNCAGLTLCSMAGAAGGSTTTGQRATRGRRVDTEADNCEPVSDVN